MGPKKKNVLDSVNGIKLFFCVYEIRLQEDLMIDDIVIVDMTNITFRDICTLSPRMVLAAVKIYKVYTQKPSLLHQLMFGVFAEYFLDETKSFVFCQ